MIINVSLLRIFLKTGLAGFSTNVGIGKLKSRVPSAVLAQVDQKYQDLHRSLPKTNTPIALDILPFDPSNEQTWEPFWHSSAHLLGYALQQLYGRRLLLRDGPAVVQNQTGFYYDFVLLAKDPGERVQNQSVEELVKEFGYERLTEKDVEAIDKTMVVIAHKDEPFERLTVSKSEAKKLFQGNPFKLSWLDALEDDQVTLYRCGSFIDFCRGPHIARLGQLRHVIHLYRHALVHLPSADGTVCRPDQDHSASQVINRVFGISFPKKLQLDEWKARRAEQADRDHRVIAQRQKLFMMHPTSPGSVFVLPHGMRMMHKLKELLRTEYDRLGYQEIATPLLYHPSLWETSGHWQNYREDMFLVGGGHGHQGSTSPSPTDSNLTGHELFGLKPMNCPAHCLIFKSESRSYRDLPIRLADFTPLHRNELSGTLTGLTRLRQFHQDDAHIFCTTDQVSNEIASILDMFHRLYIKTFKFPSYSLVLSTRPESFIGSEVDWNRAETTLKSALDQHAQLFPELPSVRVEKGAGAFYGPKIDLLLNDSQHRTHQLATVQLDFQLPHRFQLEYVSAENNRQRPVVIHRAVLGSLERFWAIWMEETKGRWDLWCNPRQILVLPVHAGCLEYAQTLMEALKNEKYHVDVDARDLSLSKRVREGQTMQYNYSVIIGDQEVSERQVAIRRRGQSATDHMSLSSFLQQLTTERDQFK